MLGFNLRWHRLTQRARSLIGQGALGPATMIASQLTSFHDTVPEWRKRRGSGGGVLFEQAVHHFDLWPYLLQSRIEEIAATTSSAQWEDESATLTARMSDGVLVSAFFAIHTGKTNDVQIFCRDGSISFCLYRFDSFRCMRGADRSDGSGIRMQEMARALRELPSGFLRLRRGGDFIASFQTEWRLFHTAIRENSPVPCTFEDGRRALQAVIAAIESARLGRAVKLEEPGESR